jgi:ubiquinone/menaquinone biosynthesis C-methylase UbiE
MTTHDTDQMKSSKTYKGIAFEGSFAKWYDKNTQRTISQYREWANQVHQHIMPGAKILEVAPGPGHLSIELAKSGDYEISGLDISHSFTQMAQEKAKEAGVKVHFQQGDAAQMPFADDTFDYIICTSAFKNFPNPIKVLNEIYRVLNAGGKAKIIDLRRDSSKKELNKYIRSMRLNIIATFMTKLTFNMLRKSSYTKTEIHSLISKSSFNKFEIVENAIGMEISLKK